MAEYAAALGITLAVEVPIYLAVLLLLLGVEWRRALGASVVVNLVSHPVVWVALHPSLGGGGRYAGVVLTVEAFAWLAEGAMLRVNLGRGTVELLAVALVANAASILVGAALLG